MYYKSSEIKRIKKIDKQLKLLGKKLDKTRKNIQVLKDKEENQYNRIYEQQDKLISKKYKIQKWANIRCDPIQSQLVSSGGKN